MPTFSFTSPDGNTYDIEAPEGATQEQAFSMLQQHLGQEKQPKQVREPTLGQKLLGAGEAALTTITGATGGALGMFGGTLGGIAGSLATGKIGTREGAQMVEESAIQGAGKLTYQPRTESGKEYAGAIGEAAQNLAPLAVVGPEMAALGASVKPAAVATRAAVSKGISEVPTPSGGALPSVGAAGTARGAQRIATAESMPVPFSGKAGLTKGQASRDFAQLQFEKETAKSGEVGAPLRERVENQTATMLQNFDALIDKPGPIHVEPRDIGIAVDKALVNKANVIKNKINTAYNKAREAGELAAPVEMEPLANTLNELTSYEGVAKNISATKKEAQRLGALSTDENGNLIPSQMTVNDAETLRQFVNDSTDWMDKREALMARKINSAIDSATEEAGGQLYREARKLRSQYADEFENVGLTSKLLGTKGKTSERQIALEDVFNKVILLSPTDEMNKLRGTLLKAGNDGKQAWADLKSKGIEHIKQSALSASQRDANGNPLLSPDKLNRVIKTMDDEGKLESLYGKKQAQTLRDLAELSTVIYTAPPGAINTSNTASALMVAMDSLAGFGATGMPVPVVTSLKSISKYVKNRKLKARINEALNQGSK